jgi:cystathionine beta-lyase family protein involved in aluminum resistance
MFKGSLLFISYYFSFGSLTNAFMYRSCGYQWRPSIPIQQLKTLSTFIEAQYTSKGRKIILFCDNCYGELVEEMEPCHVGYDLVAGSLIKNLGGTLAPCGGYIVGKEELVSRAFVHLSAPGVDGGATLNQYRHLFQVSNSCSSCF